MEEKREGKEGGDEIKRACWYLEEHFSEIVTMKELCEVSGLKKYTLFRRFTKKMGITPYQYLEAIRVDRAKKLLAEGREILDTAMECGFSDQSHFSHFFKNYIGLTPGQYQRIF